MEIIALAYLFIAAAFFGFLLQSGEIRSNTFGDWMMGLVSAIIVSLVWPIVVVLACSHWADNA